MAQEVTTYQIRITLKETEPAVWRQLEVVSNMSLNNLAWALSLSMGWECYHLYLFEVDGREYGDIERDDMGGWFNDRTIKIRDLVKRGIKSFKFIYDFGDGWEHNVEIGKEVQAQPDLRYPICIDGEYACPPEDCGGPGGFAEYKEALRDLKHERHQELLEWRGPYDPTKFDIQLANFKIMSQKIPKNLKIKNLEAAQT